MFDEILEQIKFNNKGLVPAIAQDDKTGDVLMMAWMNEEAITKTLSTNIVHYYSRSRQNLWKKGETSGHIQTLKSFFVDCDSDTILVKIDQKGVACHTGKRSCFFKEIVDGKVIDN